MDAAPPVPHALTLWPWHLWTNGAQRLETLSQRMGELPVGTVRAGPRLLHVVQDAEAVGRVLLENGGNYRKQSGSYDELRPLLGEGLFLTEGAAWKKQRKLVLPAFHHKKLQILAETMAAATAEMLERWELLATSGALFDIASEMMKLTLTVVGRALLSADLRELEQEIGRNLTFLLRETDRRALEPIPLPRWLPLPRNLRFRRAIGSLDSNVDALVAARRASARAGAARSDLLSVLLAACDQDGVGMNDRELRDQVKTLLLAGHETTASALAWTWAFLGRERAVESKLHAEVDRALEGRRPTFADLPALSYPWMVVQESMRLYPPIWIIERQAIGHDLLAGFRIPPGATVTVISYLVHRNPAHWSDPDRFDPERFAPGQEQGRHRFAYLPFGGGPRICIGNSFAMMEAQIIVAMIAQRYRVVLDDAQPVEPELAITLRTGRVMARLERRAARAPTA